MHKHLYDDDGVINYGVDDCGLLVDLAAVFEYGDLCDRDKRNGLMYDVYNAACGIVMSYQVSATMGESGLGGCKTIEEYLTSTPEDRIEQALLAIFRDMVEADIHYQYFPQVALAAFCRVVYVIDVQFEED